MDFSLAQQSTTTVLKILLVNHRYKASKVLNGARFWVYHFVFRRVPDGCLIRRISDHFNYPKLGSSSINVCNRIFPSHLGILWANHPQKNAAGASWRDTYAGLRKQHHGTTSNFHHRHCPWISFEISRLFIPSHTSQCCWRDPKLRAKPYLMAQEADVYGALRGLWIGPGSYASFLLLVSAWEASQDQFPKAVRGDAREPYCFCRCIIVPCSNLCGLSAISLDVCSKEGIHAPYIGQDVCADVRPDGVHRCRDV